MNVERLAPFFREFRASISSAAQRIDPRICLLTPGPWSETYSEQVHLARYLGLTLVEGEDLVMSDGKLHVRTIAGLKRADVIWRRVDADWCDPLEQNASSRLGGCRHVRSDPPRRRGRRQHARRRTYRIPARAYELYPGAVGSAC